MKNILEKEIELINAEDVQTYNIIFTSKNNNNETVQIELIDNIDYETLMAIADKVAELVVSDNQFKPEYRRPLYLFYILEKMTNYKSLENNEKIDINEMFQLLKSPLGKKIDELTLEIPSLRELNELINEKIAFKKEEILHKTSLDELFKSLNLLLVTLNEKANEIDTNKLDKFLKNLNSQEIVNAYQKSGVGNSLQNKAIVNE